MQLSGVRVGVVGAGLAGLSAARALQQAGAEVRVFEARARVGGRVWTIREGFEGLHGEAGADLIESDHTAVLDLARDLGLRATHILPGGFHHYGLTRTGRTTIQPLTSVAEAIDAEVGALVRAYRLGEKRWDGPIARWLAARSVASWLDACRVEPWVLERFRGLRNLFLADPEHLSMLALVDFLADDPLSSGRMLRLRGGNDQLATGLAEKLARPPVLNAVLRRVRQTRRRVTLIVDVDGRRTETAVDYCVVAIPATTLREVEFEPALPDAQQDAINGLEYGAATRLLLHFARPFWRRLGRPRAFGTALPIGAAWDGSEEQRASSALLLLLAGGRASAALQRIMARDGPAGVVRQLAWLGKPARLLSCRLVSWERDPWARGGYAVYGPGIDPTRRDWLARPAGRVLFAGEHTSVRWQGYMNGAVESGLRAVAEIVALHEMTGSRRG